MSAPKNILAETTKSYQAIVDNVIESLRQQFENTGKDTAILEVLKRTWIAKFNQTGVLGGFDLDKRVESITPQQPAITSFAHRQAAPNTYAPLHPGLSGNTFLGSGGLLGSIPMGGGMQPISRPFVPGATTSLGAVPVGHYGAAHPTSLPAIAVPHKPGGVLVAQAGVGQRLPAHPQPVPVAAPIAPKAEAKARSRALDDEELGSDDDDEELAVLGEDDPDRGAGKVRNSVLCLFEKVTRVKNKRRVVLRDGLMKIEGKEYIFNKCSGEFDW